MKIHEYNEMMAYLTRPSYVSGGRVGYSVAGIVQAPKLYPRVQSIINKGKQIFNQLKDKNLHKNEIRTAINSGLKDDLGFGIDVSSVSTKTGDVLYRLSSGTRDKVKTSPNLAQLMAERNTLVANKIKPLADKGFISSKDFTKILEDRGVTAPEKSFSQQISRIADTHGIEKVPSPFGGGNFWYKKPSPEKLESIYKLRLKPEERVPIAKKLIKDLNITSHRLLNKVLAKQGYNQYKPHELNKYFPEIKGLSVSDPKFVLPGATGSPKSVLNSIKYNMKKNMSSLATEKFLIGAKKAEDYGKQVHLMHTTAKAKKTGETLDVADLGFGSARENMDYATGLDTVRSNMTMVLQNIAKKHAGKKPDTIVEVSKALRRDYDFPKTMKLKDYIDRINIGLTDLAWKTNGKVRGELLEIVGGRMQFVDNPVVNYGIIPGKGMVGGKMKDLEPIIKKIRMEPNTGNIILDKNGWPAVKKGQQLTQDDAETIMIIWENIKTQLPSAAKSKPFKKVDINFNEGGRVGLKEGTTWGKIKSAGATSLRGLERAAGPLGTELLYLLTGTKPDPTKSQDLLLPAFWNQIMTKYNWQDKSTDPIKRRILNLAKRGLIPTAAMPAISGIASAALGPALIKDAAGLLQGQIDKQGLTGMIEEQSGMIGDEAGASLFMEDVIKEKRRKEAEGMDYNQGGRVGFAKGPKDPSKRLFLKGVGALSLVPILGKYFKLAQPATKAAAQYTGPILEGLGNKLKWVQLLAKRLWNEGEDVTKTAATAERQIVKRGTLESGDEVDMIYDVNTKDVYFEVAAKKGSGYESASGAYEQSYQLGYRAPRVIEEGKQAGKKTKAEVEVAESRPRQVTPEDVELDGDVSTVEDAISDLTELEAFAKKKTVKEIHKKKGTTPKDTNPDWEPPDYDWDDFLD